MTPRASTPHRIRGWLEDRWAWHYLLGHDVRHHHPVYANEEQWHMFDRYCVTCRSAW